MGGCLPALIQLPIFVGLWQAINTSVPLRHATFLWISDLAAPDMMFRFPWELPFLGRRRRESGPLLEQSRYTHMTGAKSLHPLIYVR